MNRTGQNRVLVASSEVVSPGEAEPAARCWQLAEALADFHDVILALPEVTGLSHRRFAVLYYNSRNLAMMAKDSDAVVVDAAVILNHPGVIEAGSPVAAGLAVPGNGGGDAAGRGLAPVLETADFFFCPTEAERGLWLERLDREGRINPRTKKQGLRQLIDVVPAAGKVSPREGIEPLAGFCAAARFAPDRGTRFSRAPLPPREEHPHGLSHYLGRLRYHLKAGGPQQAASRGGALLKRKIPGNRKG